MAAWRQIGEVTMVERIISGGQSGADQGGLAVAKRLGIPTGGFMPKGWLTEHGPHPDLAVVYQLEEVNTASYPDRTERNVLAADGTVVFGDARSRGSMLTVRPCHRHDRPVCLLPLDGEQAHAATRLRSWLTDHDIKMLNVAGNRASQAAGIEEFVAVVLERALIHSAT
jgi:hypothetical protein